MDDKFEQWKEQLQRTHGPRAYFSKKLLAKQWLALNGMVAVVREPAAAPGGTGTAAPAPALAAIPTPVPANSTAASTTAAPAVATAPSPDTLAAIRSDIGDCTRCKLSQSRKNIVFGEGSAVAKLMFVGEGPGETEDLQGRPFVGKAGDLLTKIIGAMNLNREDVYIANVVKCRPPGNRVPEPDEISTCEPFLFRQIQVIAPKVIVVLGGTALKCLLGDEMKITKSRGQFIDFKGAKLMPTFHPAYLLRNPEAKKEVWEDMKKVMVQLKA